VVNLGVGEAYGAPASGEELGVAAAVLGEGLASVVVGVAVGLDDEVGEDGGAGVAPCWVREECRPGAPRLTIGRAK
jgi:hypothetical protein